MVMQLKIQEDWFSSDKISLPVKKVLGVVYEEQYVSVGAVFSNLTQQDIVFLYLVYTQHLDEMRIGLRTGVDITGYFAIHNVSVMLTAFLIGEGYTMIERESLHKAKEKLGLILALESTGIINGKNFKSYTLKRQNYNLTEEKPLQLVEIERKK